MFKKTTLCTLAFLLVSLLSSAGQFDGKTKFYTLKTEHFYIHFPQSLSATADEMKSVVERVHERLSKRLEWNPRRRTHVVLTDKSSSANGFATILPDNYIQLFMTMPTPDTSLDHYNDYYEYLFTHEYTHILHIDQVNKGAGILREFVGKISAPNAATPGWMREGVAVYEESVLDPRYGRNNSVYTDMVLRTSHYENTFPRIDQIAGLTHHFPGGMGPYLYGGKFFQWLGENYGEDRMYQFQREYAASLVPYMLNSKARRVYGKSFYKLWKEFHADLSKRFDTQKSQLVSAGLTPLQDVVKNPKQDLSYYTPRPGGGHAYFVSTPDEQAYILVTNAQGKPFRIKRKLLGQMSFSKSGRYLAFSSLSSVEKKTTISEVFFYDFEKNRMVRVYEPGFERRAMHLSDPDFSSIDGGARWLISVRAVQDDTDQLYIYDTFERRGYIVTQAPDKTQFSNPRFSPDGSKIVVSRKDPKGNRDIVVYSNTGTELQRLTNDVAPDNHPVFSRDGSRVYFVSGRTGVFNLHEADLSNNSVSQKSNVLTGIMQPALDPATGEVYVQTYSTKRSYIQKFTPRFVSGTKLNSVVSILNSKQNQVASWIDVKSKIISKNLDLQSDKNPSVALVQKNEPDLIDGVVETHSREVMGNDLSAVNAMDSNANPGVIEVLPAPAKTNPDSQKGKKRYAKKIRTKNVQPVAPPKVYPSTYKNKLSGIPGMPSQSQALPSGSKKYSAFPNILVPGYILPNLQVIQSAVLTSLTLGRSDPLGRHIWSAFLNHRTDAQFVGGGGMYIYSRFDPTFFVGGQRYAVDWGTVGTAAGGTVRFFEERWQVYGGVTYRKGIHQFTGSYFYEHRSPLTQIAGVAFTNMHPYAGFRFIYQMGAQKKYPDSISPEDSYMFRLTTEITDSSVMSDAVNEEIVTIGDFRYYLEMPWANHHVLAFRVAGGWQWGDVQQFGTFRLGGPFGEGLGTTPLSARVFPMRGLPGITFGGDRAFLYAVEYRFPILNNVNTGIGTWPIFVDKFYMNIFSEGGDVNFRNRSVDLFDNFLVSVGAELKADMVLGYGLPITTRLGYGVVVMNRDRLGNLQDAVTGTSLRNGSVYFQLGTAF